MARSASGPLSAERPADPAQASTPSLATLDLDPLPGLIGFALKQAHTVVFNQFRRSFDDLDIRPVQLGILTIVGNNPGLTQSSVSAALGIKRPNLVPLLDALAARGLIERARPARDRRSHALLLTAVGRSLLAECRHREARLEETLAAAIGEAGRDMLIGLLKGVAASCAEDEPAPAVMLERARASRARRPESSSPASAPSPARARPKP